MRTFAGLALTLAVVVSASACARVRAPGFPPPARPGVIVPMGYEQAFSALSSMVESRGIPILESDPHFGNIRTDWVHFGPGEIDVRPLADCHLQEGAPPVPIRVRYGFEVRRRANRATVTILTQYQAESHKGFDESDRGYSDCRSTGEWERMVEESLTQRTIPR